MPGFGCRHPTAGTITLLSHALVRCDHATTHLRATLVRVQPPALGGDRPPVIAVTIKTHHRTEYRDDSLSVENGTQPDEVEAFVRRRVLNPLRVGGLTVWNFNNHKADREQLGRQADDLLNDEYLIPYQVPGAWTYMVELMPERVKSAEILVYSQNSGRYDPYPNFVRYTSREDRTSTQTELAEQLPEVLPDE